MSTDVHLAQVVVGMHKNHTTRVKRPLGLQYGLDHNATGKVGVRGKGGRTMLRLRPLKASLRALTSGVWRMG